MPPESSRARIATTAAALAAAIGALGLLGALIHSSLLTSVSAGWVTIRPAMAMALLLLGSTDLLDLRPRGPAVRWAGPGVGVLALLLGLATLADYLSPLHFVSPRAGQQSGAGRLAFTSGLGLALLGSARLTRMRESRTAQKVSECSAALAGLIACVILVGYLFGVAPIEGHSPAVPMAVTTAVGLAALSVAAIAAQPRSVLSAILSSEPPGGPLARRLLPALLGAVLLIQWLGLKAEAAGLYSGAMGDALQVLSTGVLLSALVLWSAGAVNRTVAGQRRAEANFTESEERLRAVFENAGVGLAYLTPQGRFLQVNRRMCDILGYRPDELMTMSFQEITHPAHLDADLDSLRRLTAGEGESYTTEKRYLRKDGSAVWVVLTSAAVRDPAGAVRYFVAAFNEISDRRHAEDRLRASEASYRRLVENATVGIFSSSREGRFLSVNPALVAMLGYATADDLLSLNLLTQVYVRPEDRDALLRQITERHPATGEVTWKKRDGALITVRVRIRGAPAAEDEPAHLEGLAEDVTQQRTLESQFRQAQRLEAVGRLAGGVAHDFNNILTAITGYTDLLLEELPPGDAKRDDVEEIRAAASRATSLTRQLLAFSRKQVLQTRVLSLNQLVATLQRMLQRLIGEDIKLQTVLADGLGAVRADPGQIEQIVMNLAVNARDAMPSGGALTLETANVELDESYAGQHQGVAPGHYVMLAVSDTGTGMDADTRSHLFEPFFTTKEQGKGTGLGLATVYGIVRQSGGHIWVYSEPGGGTTFKIYLPRVAEPVEPLPLAAAERPAAGGRESVLLAEDDPAVREIASQVLAHRGYRVLRAPDGQTALELARAHAGDIALLVTDIIMPGMTGRDLAEALAVERPGVRVLYMSGYTDDAVVRHGVLAAGLPYLQKPFTPEDLAHKVREVLDRA